MILWLRRIWGLVTGRHVCEEFTRWETKERNFVRAPIDINEKVLNGWKTEIEYTRRWQERQCTICGKIQQRDLKQ